MNAKRLAIRAGLHHHGVGPLVDQAMTTNVWMTYVFTQSNPEGPGEGDVARLLRGVADSIDELGEVTVTGMTFATRGTVREDALTINVYYDKCPRLR